MVNLWFVVALACAEPKLVNHTTTWTVQDAKSLARAQFVCGFRYPRSPCLVKFTKSAEQTYQALCGQGKKD